MGQAAVTPRHLAGRPGLNNPGLNNPGFDETNDASRVTFTDRLRAHFAIMRLDHSVKQVFILPGVVIAITLSERHAGLTVALRILVGLIAITSVATSNYVLNEMLDAPFDRLHPNKSNRPAASGAINFPAGYLQWLVLASAGLLIAHTVSIKLVWTVLILWIMGCFYNIPPIRTKDVPYLDVLSESINNPLRFCAGWYIVTLAMPPLSLLISYWMLGGYFMALKRFSEYRQIGPEIACAYRKSFVYYTEKSLLNSVVFYAASSMLFFGAFCMRYRLELVLAFPLIALLMAVYFDLAFQHESAVQNPERLYREPRLMVLFTVCIALLLFLLFMKLPWLEQVFPKSVVS